MFLENVLYLDHTLHKWWRYISNRKKDITACFFSYIIWTIFAILRSNFKKNVILDLNYEIWLTWVFILQNIIFGIQKKVLACYLIGVTHVDTLWGRLQKAWKSRILTFFLLKKILKCVTSKWLPKLFFLERMYLVSIHHKYLENRPNRKKDILLQ